MKALLDARQTLAKHVLQLLSNRLSNEGCQLRITEPDQPTRDPPHHDQHDKSLTQLSAKPSRHSDAVMQTQNKTEVPRIVQGAFYRTHVTLLAFFFGAVLHCFGESEQVIRRTRVYALIPKAV